VRFRSALPRGPALPHDAAHLRVRRPCSMAQDGSDVETEAEIQARNEKARAKQEARDAARLRAEEADQEAAAILKEIEAASERLRAAQERAARERAASQIHEDNHGGTDDDGSDAGGPHGDPFAAALLQQEASVLLNLHAQAVSVQNIRSLVPLLLDVNSTFYGRWKQSFLDVLGKYSLQSHVLSDVVSPHSPSWVRMNCVVRTWLLGAISERDASARVIWLAIESQFLGNHTTRALYADQEFRAFTQGDLSVVDYYRRFKCMAEDLRDLGQPVSDETLVLNIVRGLNECFQALGLHIRRTTPCLRS